ncbi:NAD(P)H-dependent oxidoreductase [Collimonas sp.]|jgi:NAD(P)H dehydrogenase (quinone)|uniref:NAD(P)H-dependent oxidoreductase n=1 Tax=Collimonas sp. TaxID=1963772 RepID=UPI002C94BA05|nr:NAD(P)H-dependent oxidoreductase [Collimonas sp.]HWX01528.1 NAD(P)H-dependent oxidoreductase [Collimonas sp.]
MLALIVIAHPSTTSMSHAMAAEAQRSLEQFGYRLVTHDLYAERFDPVQRTNESQNTISGDPLVERYCSEVSRADLILIFHPNWWGQPPAILKGWIDRVLRLDTAYRYAENAGYSSVPIGLLKARYALVFNTSNTPVEREMTVFGDPLEQIWRHCIFDFCGVKNVIRRMYGPVSGSTPEERARWLAEIAELVRGVAQVNI